VANKETKRKKKVRINNTYYDYQDKSNISDQFSLDKLQEDIETPKQRDTVGSHKADY